MPGRRKKLEESDAKSAQIDSADDTNSHNRESSAPISFQVTFEPEFWEKLWRIEQQLCDELNRINFASDKNISAIYNPLDYAEDIHKNFMRKFLRKSPTIVFLGMNPGLFGMCQTAVSDLENSNLLNQLIISSLSSYRSPSATFPR